MVPESSQRSAPSPQPRTRTARPPMTSATSTSAIPSAARCWSSRTPTLQRSSRAGRHRPNAIASLADAVHAAPVALLRGLTRATFRDERDAHLGRIAVAVHVADHALAALANRRRRPIVDGAATVRALRAAEHVALELVAARVERHGEAQDNDPSREA